MRVTDANSAHSPTITAIRFNSSPESTSPQNRASSIRPPGQNISRRKTANTRSKNMWTNMIKYIVIRHLCDKSLSVLNTSASNREKYDAGSPLSRSQMATSNSISSSSKKHSWTELEITGLFFFLSECVEFFDKLRLWQIVDMCILTRIHC